MFISPKLIIFLHNKPSSNPIRQRLTPLTDVDPFRIVKYNDCPTNGIAPPIVCKLN